MYWILKWAAASLTLNYVQNPLFDFFDTPTEPLCQQWNALHPSVHAQIAADLDSLYVTEEFKNQAYDQLSGAIQIPTVSVDDGGPVDDSDRWKEFKKLLDYLETTFPLVYERLNVTRINTYGLVLHWQGSTDKRPFLSAAHLDVVPVNNDTLSEWEQGPFSGNHSGTWIWGRGSVDDKGELIPRLISIDALLKKDFSPVRTIVLAFGFDEEINGIQGAAHIATYLEHEYGYDSFAMILDEGGALSDQGDGVYFAQPSVAEKGYVDVRIQVESPGGHSSIPPDHTSIGYLAQFITALEENPHDPDLLRNGTPFQNALCLAEHSPSFPAKLRRLAGKAVTSNVALQAFKRGLVEMSRDFNAMLRTTQAVDVVEGGVKVNALPERAATLVNHRVAQHSSVAEVQEHIIDVLLPIARKNDLTLNAFGWVVHTGRAGIVSLSNLNDYALEPSPLAPTGDVPYSILAGTFKATMESSQFYNVTKLIVGPSIAAGNSDTRHYWNLTEYIFRFSPYSAGDLRNGRHTVNEAIRAEAMIEMIRFHTHLILNLDESELP